MPLGNPIQTPGPGAMPWTPTRRYGGGAGTVYTNSAGAKTAVPRGGPMPQGQGKHGFGEIPPEVRAAFGPFAGSDPRNKAEADALVNAQTPQGSVLKDQITALRRQLMQGQKQ